MENNLLCGDSTANLLGLFDTTIAPPLLYYSYIPIMFVCLVLGIFILIKNKSLEGKLFFGLNFFFILWVLNIIVQWIAVHNNVIMFSWQLTALFEIPIYILSSYFLFVFINKKDIHTRLKLLLSGMYASLIIALPSTLNISSYDLYNCEGVVGPLWIFIYLFEFIFIFSILIYGIYKIKSINNKVHQIQTLILTIGLFLFLGLFTLTNIFGELTKTYEINLVGPLGMAVFTVAVSYIVVKYKTFNIRLIGTQVLLVSLWVLLFALLFVNKINYIRPIVASTLIFFSIIGVILIKSIKRERKQLETIAALATDLESSNRRLRELDRQKSEFVSLASHQLRGPLTAIKGYTSLILEGDMGPVSLPVKEAVDKIFKSAQSLVSIVGDFLDVSRIEQGRMKYEFTDFSMQELLQTVVDEFKPVVDQKGLQLTYKIEENESYILNGDMNKLKQVFNNLIDNSIKYTPNGWIKVSLNKDEDNRIKVRIEDNGVGMSKETVEKLFEKFSRAKNATQTNVIGTGLGLYVAKEMIKAHRGNIWAESPGEGKGSTFFVELQGK